MHCSRTVKIRHVYVSVALRAPANAGLCSFSFYSYVACLCLVFVVLRCFCGAYGNDLTAKYFFVTNLQDRII